MRVALRADSGTHIGSGHLSRSLTLASELARRGARCTLLSREYSGNLIDDLIDQRRPSLEKVRRLPARPSESGDAHESIEALGRDAFDWLVTDSYNIDASWERALRASATKLLVIDDLARQTHDCDILVDANYFGSRTATRYDGLVPANCRKLLGPRYALISADYGRLREETIDRGGAVDSILVFCGGSDRPNQTAKILDAVDTPLLRTLRYEVVIGMNHPDPDGVAARARSLPRARVHRGLPSLAPLMAKTAAFAGAGGSTTWERAVLGLSGVVAAEAPNQEELSKELARANAQLYIGTAEEAATSRWQSALESLVLDPAAHWRRCESLGRFSDGLGPSRVALTMSGARDLPITVRPANSRDEWMLLDWANDPVTRAMSFSPQAILPENHHAWFARRLGDEHTLFLIGVEGHGLPVGQVRLDATQDFSEAIVDISLDPAARGLGIAERLLRSAVDRARSWRPGITLIAEVIEANVASSRTFAAAGFAASAPRRPGSHTFALKV